jgi:hypothetical protein
MASTDPFNVIHSQQAGGFQPVLEFERTLKFHELSYLTFGPPLAFRLAGKRL